MKLDYTILWYEDDPEFLRGASRRLDSLFSELGFRLKIINEVDDRNFEKNIKNPDINLILMDFSLDGVEGDEIISKIRDEETYTEIVFYSTRGEEKIREKMKEKGVDGVYCANKDIIMDFVNKVFKISQNSLKKIQDINSARGLFISCAIDLEIEISNLVKDYLASESSMTENIRMDVIEGFLDKKVKYLVKVMESWQQVKDKFEAEKNYKLLDLEQMTFFDQYLSLSKIMKEIVKDMKKNNHREEEINKVKNLKCELDQFQGEVLDVRNFLAHVKEECDEDGNVCVVYGNKKNKTMVFNDKKYVELRKVALKHAENINDIKLLFSEG